MLPKNKGHDHSYVPFSFLCSAKHQWVAIGVITTILEAQSVCSRNASFCKIDHHLEDMHARVSQTVLASKVGSLE